MSIIETRRLTKYYPRQRRKQALVGRGGFSDWLRGKKTERFAALEDVTFTVNAGETVGIIGRNGSGKSTLLKILAGVTAPSSGEATVKGRVVSLLELGAGFHSMLTGRENIYLNAGLLGMRHAAVDTVFEQIVDFSEMGAFIDQTVDTYSSGMYVRLAFAVAVYSNPDVFLVDEVLAVGDEAFQRKCRAKIGELHQQGKTILFVSHDLGAVHSLCTRVVLLDRGHLVARRTPHETIAFYLRQVGQEGGVHTMRAGDSEAVFNHGRISLFHRERECTAAGGGALQLVSLGQYHESTAADWQMLEEGPSHCRARGQMHRLPVILEWDLRLDGDNLRWRLGFSGDPTGIEMADINIMLALSYTQWFYGDRSGEFPPVQPTDLTWTPAVPLDPTVREAGAVAGSAEGPSALTLTAVAEDPAFRLQWGNADYLTGARIFHAGARQTPESVAQTLNEHWAELQILFHDDSETAAARAQTLALDRVTTVGPLAARIERGWIELRYDGVLLTKAAHLHTEFSAGNIWHFSQTQQWGGASHVQGGIEATARATRAPVEQRWRLSVEGDALRLQVWARTLGAGSIDDFNVSVVLDPTYARWTTPAESASFPPLSAQEQDWRHLNSDYGQQSIRAEADTLPTVQFEAIGGAYPVHMTVLNSGAGEQSRVLQAIVTAAPGSGVLPLKKTPTLLFDGLLRVTEQQDA